MNERPTSLRAPTLGTRPEDQERAGLYALLEQYLAALRARSPDLVPWAEDAKTTENNVALHIGDGLWGSVTGLGEYQLRFADVQLGSVGFHGVIEESGSRSPFAMRLKASGERITEVETIVARARDSGVPFVTAELADRPSFNEIVSAELRSSRAQLLAIANGYFDTLQRNDGTLHVQFEDSCNRRENGTQTTNNPQASEKYGFIMGLACAEQFKLGYYRFDDRLRSRRALVIDEERGLIMMAAFIDHSGRIDTYTLTDGRTISSKYRPHSYVLLETFKVRGGRIADIEAVFTTVPYRMPSPWVAAGFAYE
jgi:hypothetical protein